MTCEEGIAALQEAKNIFCSTGSKGIILAKIKIKLKVLVCCDEEDGGGTTTTTTSNTTTTTTTEEVTTTATTKKTKKKATLPATGDTANIFLTLLGFAGIGLATFRKKDE